MSHLLCSCSVLGQTGIAFEDGQGVGVYIFSRYIGLAEDLLEVLMSDGGEVLAVLGATPSTTA